MDNGFHPVPKPAPDKKKKLLQNGYSDKPHRYCYYCGTSHAERHEVYGGANRQTSISHGFQVDLCRDCHEEIEKNISERGQARNHHWQQHFQELYETRLSELGLQRNQARMLWMKLIGRNYLEQEE